MPLKEENGKWKYGKHGHPYNNKEKAIKQAVAISYSEFPDSEKKRERYLNKHLGHKKDSIIKDIDMTNRKFAKDNDITKKC